MSRCANANMCAMLTISHSIRYYLSERFRLRFEDSGLEDMMEEDAERAAAATVAAERATDGKMPEDEGIDVSQLSAGDSTAPNTTASESQMMNGTIRTLDGEIAGDELEGDAINYQILLGKIDALLERLKLDA